MYNTVEVMRLTKGQFSLLWRMIADKRWKATRKELMEANVEKYCNDLLERIPFGGDHEAENVRFSLYLLSILSTGIVQLQLKRTELLLRDVEKLKALLFSKLKEDGKRGDDNATQLGSDGVLPEVGRKRKRKDGMTMPNIGATLVDLANDLDKMAIDGELQFGTVARMSDITLQEVHPMGIDDDLVDDDFGMITPEQRRILEGVMHDSRGADSRADKAEVAIVANHPSDDHTREALAIAGAEFAVGTAAEVESPLVQDSVEVTSEGGRGDQIWNHDAQVDQRPVSIVSSASGKQLSSLALDVLLLDEPDRPTRTNVHRKAWADRETQLSVEFLRARMNDYSDTVRTRDELIVRDPKKQFVPCSEMFDLRPATLRLNPTLCELFVGSRRDQIALALQWDEGVSFSSAAKYQRAGNRDDEESSSAKRMEHASVSTLEHSERSSGEVKKISEMRMDSLMSGTDMRPEDDIPSNLLLQSDYAQMGAVKAMAAEGDEAEQIDEPGESSAARFFFRKDTHESSVSVQERERRSTGFWGISRENERADAVMLDTTNPDVMGLEKSTNLLDNLNASMKGTNPSPNGSSEGQVHVHGQADESGFIEELCQKILGIARRKGGDVVMISELLDKGCGRLVAARTFCSLLWLIKRELVTAQQDVPFGDIRITIIRRET